jgi:hypothetical protein
VDNDQPKKLTSAVTPLVNRTGVIASGVSGSFGLVKEGGLSWSKECNSVWSWKALLLKQFDVFLTLGEARKRRRRQIETNGLVVWFISLQRG